MVSDFKTTPAMPGVMPVIPDPTSRFFNKARIRNLDDLKEGHYIRVWWQPLYANGSMMAIEHRQFAGKPYRYKNKETSLYGSYKIKKRLSSKEAAREAFFDKAPASIRELGRSQFTSDLGVGGQLFARHSAQLFRFSSKMLLELERIQSMGDFATFCWFHNMTPSVASYVDFVEVVEMERYEERIFNGSLYEHSETFYDDPLEDPYDDRHVDDTSMDDAAVQGKYVDDVVDIDENTPLASDGRPLDPPLGPYDHLEDLKFNNGKAIL